MVFGGATGGADIEIVGATVDETPLPLDKSEEVEVKGADCTEVTVNIADDETTTAVVVAEVETGKPEL